MKRVRVAVLLLSLLGLGLFASCCCLPRRLEPAAQEPPLASHTITEWGEGDGVGARFALWRYDAGSWRSVETVNAGMVTRQRGT